MKKDLLQKSKGRMIFGVILAALLLTGCARSDAKAAYTSGCSALESADAETAIAYFQASIDAGYYLSQSYRGIGLAYLESADYADACIAFEKSLLYVDGESEAYQRDVSLYLAYSRERQGQTDKAMELYDTLIKKNPDAETLFLRGRLNLRSGSLKAAKADFDQAILLSPNYDLYINIFEIYEEEDKSGDGAHYLEEALKEASKNADDYYNQGLVNYYLQNYEEARDILVQAIKQEHSDAKSVFLLGQIYLAMNDAADARAIFKEYISDEAVAASAYNGLALCDIASEEYESALQDIQSGLAAADEETEQALLYNEIVVYEKMHDWKNARIKAAAYVAKYPTDEAGAKEYEFLATRA